MSENLHETVLPEDWVLPGLSARNEAWFTSGSITVQACAECSTRQHPPEEICHNCGSMTFGQDTLSPNGTVHSYTIVHYAVNRNLVDSVPYAVVLVSLDDAPELRVIGNMPGVPVDEVKIDMKVEAIWEQRIADDEAVIQLPQWQPR